MYSPELARTTVDIIGTFFAVCFFLSPLPTFFTIWKRGSVEQYSPMPYLAAFISCMAWVLYGLPMVHPHSTSVAIINGAGCVIQLLFLILFIVFSGGGSRLRVIVIAVAEIVLVAVLGLLVITMVHDTAVRSAIIGAVCILLGIMMYAAPLFVMRLVIRTKSVEYMPFLLSFAALGNGLAWTAYGVIFSDLFITIPNGLGTLLAVAQLIIYALYYKSTKEVKREG